MRGAGNVETFDMGEGNGFIARLALEITQGETRRNGYHPRAEFFRVVKGVEFAKGNQEGIVGEFFGDFFVVGYAGTDSQCPLSETGINNALGTRVARFGLFNQMYHVCHDYLETYSLRMTAWKT